MKDSTLVRQNSKFKINHKICRKSCFEFKMKTGESNFQYTGNYKFTQKGRPTEKKKKSQIQLCTQKYKNY